MQENQNVINNIDDDGNVQSPHYDMSVILITPDTYDTVRWTVQALQRQTAKDKLELVFVVPSTKDLRLIKSDLEVFAGYQLIEIGEINSTAFARAAGVFAAQASVIVFAESHCFPAPTWAEALIFRQREPWAGVGPIVCNANPATALSWSNFLIEYGEWIGIETSDSQHHIPGNNGSYKREALLEYGSDLANMLEADSPMQWDMQSRGHTFCMESQAKTFHLNFSVFFESLVARFYSGRLFATSRSQKWTKIHRFLYFGGSPLIPLIRLDRILRTLYRSDQRRLIPRTLLYLIIFLIFDGIGEMVGYAFGPGEAMKKISDREFYRERYLGKEDQNLIGNIDKLISPNH